MSDFVFDPGDIDKMMERLEALRSRHRELDSSIETLELNGANDIQIMGLKREKLRVKDQIVWLSSKLTPDIIA
ncbi:MAG TPA: YdcH family protein [Hyphomonadaceae bacterium]|nr:YdcH family protein [Hyphomonadaceae bacterium]